VWLRAQQLDDYQIGVLDPVDVQRLKEQPLGYPQFFDTSPPGAAEGSVASTGACQRGFAPQGALMRKQQAGCRRPR
jgi:hypothetical protein